MFALLATVAVAAPLPLPMPTGSLCASADEVTVYAGPVFYEGDADWMAPVDCAGEAGCLAAIARMEDPATGWVADRVARGESFDSPPVGTFVMLTCGDTATRESWSCDAAGCSLTSSREVRGMSWTSLDFDTLPGRPDRTVSELVSLDDAALKSRATSQLADLVKGTARRMDAALRRCEEGLPCDAGWKETRALTTPFLTDGRASFVSFERGMWGQEGFEATYTAAQDPSAEVTLSCYLVAGGCDWSAATCALAFGPADAPKATFTANDDTTKWGNSSVGLARWSPEAPVVVTRSEGWLPRTPVAAPAVTAAVEETAAR